jgi:hypothetical protein
MAKSPSKHREALQQEKPDAAGPAPAPGHLPTPAVPKPASSDNDLWGYGIGLIIWMASFFGLFIMVIIEMLIGIFR